MDIHYILVVASVLVIVAYQLGVFSNTQRKIKSFKATFPKSPNAYGISVEELESEEGGMIDVSQIQVNTNNETMKSICDALNMYLKKNRGAASDFNLIKDVVERYCNAKEEEISIQQPIPLYLGLMGTMVGIIIGIGYLALNGGLVDGFQMEHISSLMTCVAIAMVASLLGIVCTTSISWSSKTATSEVEANKNTFYSWIQTQLLPVLSGNTVNALYLLQQNLMTFNQTFQSNIAGLDAALSRVESTSQEQVELISLIRDIDVRRVAQANVTVLRELKSCTAEIATFNQYLHNVSNYLNAVNELNANLNQHLTRTAAIERMGEFFEREINQVQTREQYINEIVANVDDTLRRTFNELSESTRESINILRNQSVAEFDALNTHYSEQREDFKNMMREQSEEWANYPTEMNGLKTNMREMVEMQSSIIDRLLKIEEQSQVIVESTKEQMQIIAETSREQTQAIRNLSEILEGLKYNAGNNIPVNSEGEEKNTSKELESQTGKSAIMVYPTWYMVLYLMAFIALVVWMIVRYL